MIQDNIIKIRQRIEVVCAKVKRLPEEITIVAVGKDRPLEQIKQAVGAGLTNIGENKVQEALIKYNKLTTRGTQTKVWVVPLTTVKWHMVGHLQTNKVSDAVRLFDLIHSVDTIRLAEEINKQAAKINKIQDILVEVNTSGETAKFGFKPDEVIEAVKQAAKLGNIKTKGLMTIAPMVDNPELSRPYFKLLRELRDQINTLHILSMGMTNDFEIAIEEGANMIRLGRAIFGE